MTEPYIANENEQLVVTTRLREEERRETLLQLASSVVSQAELATLRLLDNEPLFQKVRDLMRPEEPRRHSSERREALLQLATSIVPADEFESLHKLSDDELFRRLRELMR